jgi:glycosyltransferase involved in cell wall biosynthesis
MHANRQKKVSVVYRFMPHYRAEFFNRLRTELGRRGIVLDLVYGKNATVPKQDEVDLEWATAVTNLRCQVGPLELYWQPLPQRIRDADLVILMQENTLLSNYPLLMRGQITSQRTAFWDHGLNLQAPPDHWANRFKRLYATRVSWWFAYTCGVAQRISAMGFPEGRITVVQNAIDTRLLCRQAAEVDESALKMLRGSLGIRRGPVGMFCGGMYKEKRLSFLLRACGEIRRSIPEFEMIFVGAGPDSHFVVDASRQFDWIHYVGPKFRAEVVPLMKLAGVFLMPGVVGLGILDAFAMQKPFVTTTYPYHGPEIEYLINGENGIMTDDSPEAFAAGVVDVLSSGDLRSRIQEGCRKAAATYTLEAMVSNFTAGVENALNA